MNTIIFELCAEDRARLDAIIGALGKLGSRSNPLPELPDVAAALPLDVQEAAKAETQETAPPAAKEATTAPQEAEPAIKHADVLALVQKLIAPPGTKRKEAKAIVNQYAETVSGIPAEKCQEVWQQLTDLDKREG